MKPDWLGTQILVVALVLGAPKVVMAQVGDDHFNRYILEAVEVLHTSYAAQGYANSSYTHAMPYGPDEQAQPSRIVKPSNPPYTMCVAAMGEVIITALNLYMDERVRAADTIGVQKVLNYLPVEGWSRMRPKDIRSHLWVDPRLKSSGTADALSTFGVGHHAKFSELKPGAFVNVNRLNKSGHAVVFLGYIDQQGRDLPVHGPSVAGFRYFSAQGKPYSKGSGFGYRWAFFNQKGKPFCPKLERDRLIDCGIISRADQVYLNTGYMLHPDNWDASYRDESLKKITERIYIQNYSKGPTDLPLPSALTRAEFMDALNTTDTMKLNPKYLDQSMPND